MRGICEKRWKREGRVMKDREIPRRSTERGRRRGEKEHGYEQRERGRTV